MASRESKGKRLAKIGTGMLLAFLAFAPPGTMIFIGLFLLWLFGDDHIAWIVILSVIVVGAGLVLIWKIRSAKG